MRALNSHFVVIDLHCSWHSTSHHLPTSALAYLQSSNLISTVSSSFRRTRRSGNGIRSARSSSAWIPSPEIRRPSDRFSPGNGSPANSQNVPSTSRPEAATELEMFLQLLPLKMRRELYRHKEIGALIEVVMDLGRKPLARFPSGDWVISEQPIKHEDLRHAISKVGE